MMKSFGLTDKGSVRKDNQDCFIIERCDAKGCLVLGLCDGMGGAKAGGVASQLSNKAFVSHIYGRLTARVQKRIDYEQLLKEACSEANGVSFEYSQFDEAFHGMGTTLVGGIVKYGGAGYIVNVGDSRAYLITHRGRQITQITRDHSLVEELVEYGAITAEEARVHPQKNIITRAVGSEASVEADYFHFSMKAGDVLLLCSDGLSNMMTDEEIRTFAENGADPETICRDLMDCALERGAKDNVTVLAVVK
ncbi:MAG: Stp1/IreP family PP2C-type Ser/Thr phosphatase [Oscillospiraceae bacterium]|nr:Stp1/IreP family PP2C-type Ser/Thr phosphatase [Oscillospiraceae bacterium]